MTQVAGKNAASVCYWDGPDSVWSLFAMICNLGIFVHALDQLRQTKELFETNDPDADLNDFEREVFITTFFTWQVLAKRAGMANTLTTTEHVIGRYDRKRNGPLEITRAIKASEATQRMGQIEENYRRDTGDRLVLLMDVGKSDRYYKTFGDDIDKKFPDATKEIKEAHKCYACNRNTASVFHLMRAVEHGLRAFAIAVGIPTTKVPLEYQVWNTIIEAIEAKIEDAPNTWPEPAKSSARAFFRRLVSDLYAFKDDTRNVLMHTRYDLYDAPRTESVRNRVEEFFTRTYLINPHRAGERRYDRRRTRRHGPH